VVTNYILRLCPSSLQLRQLTGLLKEFFLNLNVINCSILKLLPENEFLIYEQTLNNKVITAHKIITSEQLGYGIKFLSNALGICRFLLQRKGDGRERNLYQLIKQTLDCAV
jgi:hypothetical protein